MITTSLIPPAVDGGESGGDEDLVDRGEKVHPRVALGKSARVLGEEVRPLRVLKIAQPVGNAEVTKIRDWCDAEFLEVVERLVGEAPVVDARREVSLIVRRTIPKEFDSQLLHQIKIFAPVVVVSALGEAVYPLRG